MQNTERNTIKLNRRLKSCFSPFSVAAAAAAAAAIVIRRVHIGRDCHYSIVALIKFNATAFIV